MKWINIVIYFFIILFPAFHVQLCTMVITVNRSKRCHGVHSATSRGTGIENWLYAHKLFEIQATYFSYWFNVKANLNEMCKKLN